ncbi:MAG: right-handed parallel beta-helix repeat-containing protein [Pseudomonadota bacterium]
MKKRWLVFALLLAPCLAAVGGAWYLQQQGVTPRALAPYVERRSSGHNVLIEGVGAWTGATLMQLDRGTPAPNLLQFPRIGAQPQGASQTGAERLVATSDEVRKAIADASPGDVITLLPGAYRFERASISVSRPGSAQANIVVRARKSGSVTLDFSLSEGFIVSAPYWRFENLDIRGVCKVHAFCEHAFHVVGAATNFVSSNNTIVDFNAHFKINGERGRFPDHGRIEYNTLRNDSVRDTSNPVTPIDIVAASHWTIRGNLISDFIKGSGDHISYGAFAKGAGANNVFEQNVIVCEARLQGLPGQRVGLSLGGGGSGKDYCRDRKCITEQEQGVIRSNLIASCSDDGIYLNNAAASKIVHNTLIDTGGMLVRFAASSADIEGNLVDGDIRSRDGGVLRLDDNRATPIALLYAGYHPVRRLFGAPQGLNFAWRDAAPRRAEAGSLTPDLCGVTRPGAPAYGAFEDIAACLK